METLQMNFTPPGDLDFYRNPQGFLALRIGGEDHPRVQLRRALPLSEPDRYICVADMEGKEVAVLEDIAAFDEAAQELLQAELGIRYFYPEVKQVKSVKEKMGAYYFSLLVDNAGGENHEKTIAVKDISKNLKQLGGGRIILTDVDGNRFLIPDVYKIQKKSLRMLEPYLY